ncbi:RNA polymerase sigma factor [Microbacterium sp. T2.11-28]|uniref:RNA polymerase sigma factor n=1 Tax=Microbacterium sp. T2.11-28 TaxID=3041169 RepID=UPI0024774FF6|nr:RNA polymerase sigma factor [Microbacterium sp. T2.11-28]CAI9386730.1 ECF RNA polymerase sigma factor SigE [Microbacterium sp. T2.11-28]
MRDSELWRLIVEDGDERALAELYECHVDRVFRHAARLAGDRRDAEDATAVAFFEMWRKRDRVRLVDGSPLPWLLATTTHALRNLTRSSARYRKLLDALPRTDTRRSAADEIADQAAVQEMLAPLGRIEQQLVVLSVFEGFTSSEAGAAVGLSAGAARTRLTRARARIRAHLTTSDATREETA